MKPLYLIAFITTFSFSSFSQSTDTCDYVAQNNQIGGLDCYMGTLAPFMADTFQWLDCGNSFAPLPGDTLEYYSGVGGVTVALELTYLGCVDTSECQYVCSWGLEELLSNEVELVKILDPMGRETDDEPNTLLIYVYSDGTAEKVYRVE